MAGPQEQQEQSKSFKYVYIPADPSEPIQERQLAIPPGQDVECLMDELKAHFSAEGGSRGEAQRREAQRQALLSQLTAEQASALQPGMLEAALNIQMVENIALLANAPDVGHVGVNMYCDDHAQAKDLPFNPRATQIADCCGRMVQVRGDAFIARIFDNDDDFKRMDFTIGEVSSSAPWVAAAREQIRKRGSQSTDGIEQLKAMAARNRQKAAAPPPAQVRELTPAEAEKEAGNEAYKKGQWEQAVQHYSSALSHDPKLTAALNNRAMAFLKLGRLEEAEADCGRVLELEPANVKALLRRGTARASLGRHADAAADFEGVLAQQPGNKEAAQGLEAARAKLSG